jgi:cell division protease FtsH
LVFGDLSTGASDDLQHNTELARKMVREWGMSERVGPMAWGSQGMVFLGEDLMHTRDYSEDTSRVVDEEVARILREQEARATDVLREHRAGLEAVAHALLEFEKVDGAEIGRLVDAAYGKPVHGGDEGEEKLATERYAPSLSGGVMAQSAPGVSSTGIPPDHMLALDTPRP